MNDLNVFKPDFYSWKYPHNWYKNIRLFFRQFKWAYQRITRGFCDPDWWDLDCYLTRLMADSIETLAEKTISYPGNVEFPTPEAWHDYLMTIVAKLRYSYSELPNEYEDAWMKTWDKKDPLKTRVDSTPEEKEIINNFFEIEQSNSALKYEALQEGLEMVWHVYDHLWD